MRFVYFILLLMIISPSCSDENIHREVFIGLCLGKSVSENNKIINSLYSNKIIRKYKNDFYIEQNVINVGRKDTYYMSPLLLRSDSVVTGVKILVVDKKEDISRLIDEEVNNRKSFNLGESKYNWNTVESFIIETDLNIELKKKYGNPTSYDTTSIDMIGRIYIDTWKWNNKDGVDITFQKETSSYWGEKLVRMTVLYELNNKLLEKYKEHKSIF